MHRRLGRLRHVRQRGRCRQPTGVPPVPVPTRSRTAARTRAGDAAMVGRYGSGLTLPAYAEAKKLPPDLLESLGVTETNYFGQLAVRIPYRDADGNERAVRIRKALKKRNG